MDNALLAHKIAIIAIIKEYVPNAIRIILYLIMENAVNVLIIAVFVPQMKIMK
jgi:uncharacterized membrane protein YecN with MAPEG domain